MRKYVLPVGALTIVCAMLSFSPVQKFDLKASIGRGAEVYTAQCMSCHMDKGEGLEGVYPPLAKSDYLAADKKRSIEQVLHGVTGEIKVNGKTYNGEMIGFDMLSDTEISDVLNYIRNSFGNKGEAVTPEEIKSVRK
jgi:mono/diheme cytochrome c family protein